LLLSQRRGKAYLLDDDEKATLQLGISQSERPRAQQVAQAADALLPGMQ